MCTMCLHCAYLPGHKWRSQGVPRFRCWRCSGPRKSACFKSLPPAIRCLLDWGVMQYRVNGVGPNEACNMERVGEQGAPFWRICRSAPSGATPLGRAPPSQSRPSAGPSHTGCAAEPPPSLLRMCLRHLSSILSETFREVLWSNLLQEPVSA